MIYASNEEGALLAVASDEYRDNHGEICEVPVLLLCEVCFLWLKGR